MTTAQAGEGRRRFTMGPCLGRGGHGEVYRARMRSPGGLETEVAVKVLRIEVDLGRDAVRRLRDEGRLLARLDHPTIVRVYDLVELDGRLALVTELVDGADLAQLFGAADRVPPRTLLQVVAQVAGALEVAWSSTRGSGSPLRLVHRDVKPSNIRIGRHGQVKLVDFGIARAEAVRREAYTHSDAIIGSMPYLAPERFVRREAGPASDVFALGAVLFEGLVRERFYGADARSQAPALAWDASDFERFAQERLSCLPQRTPTEVVELLRRTMAHAPEARPRAATLAATCERLGDDLAGTSLRAWVRQLDWPERSAAGGALAGRVLVEGSLVPHIQETPRPAPASDEVIVRRPGGPALHSRARLTIDPLYYEEESAVEATDGLADSPVGAPLGGRAAPVIHRAPQPTSPTVRPSSLDGLQRPSRSLHERAYTDEHPRHPSTGESPMSTDESQEVTDEITDEITDEVTDDSLHTDLRREGGLFLIIGVAAFAAITILGSIALIAAVLIYSAL